MASMIIALILIGMITLFSVQNADTVAVSFLFWKFQSSLAIVIFLSAVAGVIAGMVIALVLKRKRPAQKASPSQEGTHKQT